MFNIKSKKLKKITKQDRILWAPRILYVDDSLMFCEDRQVNTKWTCFITKDIDYVSNSVGSWMFHGLQRCL